MVNIRYACITVHIDQHPWTPPTHWPAWISYVEGQLELSTSNQSQHWQLYAEATVSGSLTQWKTVFGKHCHVETRRGTLEQALQYVRKQESRLHGPNTTLLYGELHQQKHTTPDRNKTYQTALAQPTYNQAMDFLKTEVPRDFVIYNTQISNCLKTVFAPKFTPPTGLNWIVNFIPNEILSTKAVFITGCAGSGKTTWALSHFKLPILISHIDDLKRFNPAIHDGLVFDDMTFQHWPPTSCIHICDMDFDRSINVKYGTANIPRLTKRIFTTNVPIESFFSDKCTDEQWNAIYRRVFIYTVDTPLY